LKNGAYWQFTDKRQIIRLQIIDSKG